MLFQYTSTLNFFQTSPYYKYTKFKDKIIRLDNEILFFYEKNLSYELFKIYLNAKNHWDNSGTFCNSPKMTN
jgi:hypothetical protein